MKRRINGTVPSQIFSPDYDSKRPPLVPLGLAATAQTPQTPYGYSPRHPQRVFFSRSDYSDGHYNDDESEKFDLMNVTVVIYNLSGIMCEKEPEIKRRSKFDSREMAFGLKVDNSHGRISGSTISSYEPCTSDNGALFDNIGAATTALISCRKNAYSSQTWLESFLPSVPINYPMKSMGSKYRYQASWPSEQSLLSRDDTAVARSSFMLTRCMKQEGFVPGTGIRSNYVHETLELRINLSRGTELLRLGTATLVLSGDEEGEVQMLLPAKPLDQKKQVNRNRVKAKPNKYGYFSGDLTRRFFLDENSTLRVGIRVRPQDKPDMAGDRERNENISREMWGSSDLKQIVQKMGNLDIRNGALRGKFYDDSEKTETSSSIEEPEDLFQSLFCGALCATNSNFKSSRNSSEVPRVVRAHDFAQLGIESLMSSVSESTDGSDYSEGDIEDEMSNFRMLTSFQRYT